MSQFLCIWARVLHMRGGLVDGSIKDLEDFEILVGSKIGTWVGTNLQMCV